MLDFKNDRKNPNSKPPKTPEDIELISDKQEEDPLEQTIQNIERKQQRLDEISSQLDFLEKQDDTLSL